MRVSVVSTAPTATTVRLTQVYVDEGPWNTIHFEYNYGVELLRDRKKT